MHGWSTTPRPSTPPNRHGVAVERFRLAAVEPAEPEVEGTAAVRWRSVEELPSSARWKRFTFPVVVVGERGAVSRWSMPFSRQVRSEGHLTGAGTEPAGEDPCRCR